MHGLVGDALTGGGRETRLSPERKRRLSLEQRSGQSRRHRNQHDCRERRGCEREHGWEGFGHAPTVAALRTRFDSSSSLAAPDAMSWMNQPYQGGYGQPQGFMQAQPTGYMPQMQQMPVQVRPLSPPSTTRVTAAEHSQPFPPRASRHRGLGSSHRWLCR